MHKTSIGLSRIALVHPSAPELKETFLQNQIDYLPFNIVELCGGFMPYRTGSGKNTSPKMSKLLMLISSILHKVKSSKSEYFHKVAIKRVLKKNKVQLVLAEYGPTGVSMLSICEELKIPLVVYFLGFDASRFETLKKYNNYADLFAKSSSIIGVSKDICHRLTKMGCSADKIHHNVCGAAEIFFDNPRQKNTQPILVSVGRFVSKKAPYFTILAFHKVIKEIPDAQLIMIGDGAELFDACTQLILALGLEKNVQLLGTKTPTEISEILKNARAFVQHSIIALDGDSEGTPVAILEAGAQGLPVISTLHGGIPEIVIHNETGFLGPERDFNLMADYMIQVLKNPELSERLGMNAKKHVAENFNIKIAISNLTEILKETFKVYSENT